MAASTASHEQGLEFTHCNTRLLTAKRITGDKFVTLLNQQGNPVYKCELSRFHITDSYYELAQMVTDAEIQDLDQWEADEDSNETKADDQ